MKIAAFIMRALRLWLPMLLSPLLRFIPVYLSDDRLVSQIFDADVMRDIDMWLRYNAVASQLKRMRCQSVLDVGGEYDRIARFFRSNVLICTLNIRKEPLSYKSKIPIRSHKSPNPIVADGCNLPFTTNSFDAVVSLQTFQQIPKSKRQDFLKELKRVGKIVMILDATESFNGVFKGWTFGVKFNNRRRLLGFDYSLFVPQKPSFFLIDEIRKAYPNAEYIGHKNCDAWLQYTTFSRIPILNLLTGLLYLNLWRERAYRRSTRLWLLKNKKGIV